MAGRASGRAHPSLLPRRPPPGVRPSHSPMSRPESSRELRECSEFHAPLGFAPQDPQGLRAGRRRIAAAGTQHQASEKTEQVGSPTRFASASRGIIQARRAPAPTEARAARFGKRAFGGGCCCAGLPGSPAAGMFCGVMSMQILLLAPMSASSHRLRDPPGSGAAAEPLRTPAGLKRPVARLLGAFHASTNPLIPKAS